MTGPKKAMGIYECQQDGILRLSLTGELDRWSVPILEDRLSRLRAMRVPVSLDLSGLQYVDSTGVRLLIQSLGDARMKRWQFQLEGEVGPKVLSVFRMVHLNRFVDSAPPVRLASTRTSVI